MIGVGKCDATILRDPPPQGEITAGMKDQIADQCTILERGIDSLARQVKESGITRLEGDILVDDRLFVRGSSSGSGPDAVTPIMINDNVVDIIVTGGDAPGDTAKITTRPTSNYYQLDVQVVTVESESSPSLQVIPSSLGDNPLRWSIIKVNGVSVYSPTDLYSRVRGEQTIKLTLIDYLAVQGNEVELELP